MARLLAEAVLGATVEQRGSRVARIDRPPVFLTDADLGDTVGAIPGEVATHVGEVAAHVPRPAAVIADIAREWHVEDAVEAEAHVQAAVVHVAAVGDLAMPGRVSRVAAFGLEIERVEADGGAWTAIAVVFQSEAAQTELSIAWLTGRILDDGPVVEAVLGDVLVAEGAVGLPGVADLAVGQGPEQTIQGSRVVHVGVAVAAGD